MLTELFQLSAILISVLIVGIVIIHPIENGDELLTNKKITMKKASAFIIKLFKKIPVKFRFMAFVIGAFIAAISFMNVRSVNADKWQINGLLIIIGIVFTIITITIFFAANAENKE